MKAAVLSSARMLSLTTSFLDVILVEGIRKIKLLFCLPTAFFGKHVGIRGIHILTCSDIHVHSASALPIHIDGESGGIREDLTVSIEKAL